MSMDTTARVLPGEIMVVEDTDGDRKLLLNILTDVGYRVRPASDGELALRSIHAKQPDLILMDINMPGMSGVDVCRKLKADPTTKEIPVIFVSAEYGTDLIVKALDAGGVDYVTKPYHVREVLARVGTHFRMSQLQRKLVQQSKQLLAEIAERKRAEKTLEQYRNKSK